MGEEQELRGTVGSRAPLLVCCIRQPITDGQTVDSLFDDNQRSWNEPLVRIVYEEHVAEQVLQVPISRHGGEDFICWPHTKSGTFSVRTAYHMARSDSAIFNRSKRGRGMISDGEGEAKMWKAIKAPGKMLITLWRFAHD